MKAGIIGCGFIAKKAHLPAYRDLNIDVVGVADSNGKRAKSCAKKFKIKKWFTNYNDLLKEDLDLVSICTPPDTHAQITIDAAKAGENVLVEKPMARNLEDAERIIRICKDSGVKLCVVHNYRFFPCVLEAKKRLEEGRIGRIVSMHAVGRDYIDVMSSPWRFEKWGVLEDFGPHIIDIVNLLCNSSPEDAKVVARDYMGNMGCLNHVQAILLFKNRACADIDISWLTGAFEFTFKILGTAGTLDIDVRNNHLREIHGYSTPVEELASLSRKSLKIAKAAFSGAYFSGPLLYHQLILKEFIESIIKDTEPPITVKEAIEVMKVMELIKNRIENENEIF